MDYPVWWLPGLSNALPVAIIAVVHVFVAHFAIGGGLFLVLVERLGLKAEGGLSQSILAYGKRHTRFFMLLTLVFGGLTGVGIWFVIGAASPAATNLLIHTFVFGWATEWVFFIGEIVALLIYYYTYGKMRARPHQTIGWLYFAFGWLSLFMINGIIGFMLTPGAWPETASFWDGFFNPSFWPSLVFRSMLCVILAGVFGYLTAVRIPEAEARERMVRFSTWMAAGPFLPLIASAAWYLLTLPEGQMDMILQKSREIPPLLSLFAVSTPLVFLGALALTFVTPQKNRPFLAWVLLILAFIQLGAFEWTREAGRRPYVVWDIMYSNSIPTDQVAELDAKGVLSKAKWVRHKEITKENRLQVGEELFRMQCVTCHSIGGAMLDILPRTEKYSQFGMEAQLTGQGVRSPYMPPFVGNDEEKAALAAYVVEGLHGKKPQAGDFEPPQLDTPELAWNEDSEYLLLAWNGLGMRTFSDAGRFLSVMPPGNNFFAQLLKRDSFPELISEGVVLEYSLQEGFENPAAHLRYWETMIPTFHLDREPNQGLRGNFPKGEMYYSEAMGLWTIDMVPVSPYAEDGSVLPYPLLTVRAKDAESGELLAETQAVAPASTEMGCKNCHGGEWRMPEDAGDGEKQGVMGFVDATAADILAMHDKRSGTKLLKEALWNHPKPCQYCHPDAGMTRYRGDAKRLSLSASIHGFHAPYLKGRGAEACDACHASSPMGATRMLRGLHNEMALTCTDCHGEMADHALALLKAEEERGNRKAATLMQGLVPETAASVEEIAPRQAWLQEPDCLSCHVLEGAGGEVVDMSGFNKWTEPGKSNLFRLRKDAQGAMMCVACHNTPHAIYPTVNPYGEDRDNMQPLRYAGSPRALGSEQNCVPCHTMDMGDFTHHPEE